MRLSWLTLGRFPKEQLLEMVRECDASGFETFWYADERFYMETYSSLTLASTASKRIQLGPGVTDPFSRHPALTAMAMGTLDHFSDGRAILGLGAGSSGFKQLMMKRVHPAQAIREAVKVIRGLLAGESVTLDGQVIKIQDARLNFTPRGQVPILVASNGQLIVQVAGEVGDGVISSSVLVQPRIDEVLEYVEKGLAKSGRKRSDFTVWSRLNISAHPDSQAAYRALKPMVYNLIAGKYPDTQMFDGLGLPLPDDLRETVIKVGPTHNPALFDTIINQVPDEFVSKTCLVGSPREIIKQLQELEAAGFDGALLYAMPVEGQSIEEMLQMIVKEILPAVTKPVVA